MADSARGSRSGPARRDSRRDHSTARGHEGLSRGLSFLCVVLVASAVHAEKRRVRLGVQPVYALAYVDRRDPSGGGVGVDLAFGVTDALAVRLTGLVSFHAADGPRTPMSTSSGGLSGETVGPSGSLSAYGAFAGISYSLDVLRIVPTFDLGLGVLGLRGDARFGTDAGANALLPQVNALAIELGFGADYLISRRWSVGFVLRYHALLTELERAPSFLYVGPRVSMSLPF